MNIKKINIIFLSNFLFSETFNKRNIDSNSFSDWGLIFFVITIFMLIVASQMSYELYKQLKNMIYQLNRKIKKIEKIESENNIAIIKLLDKQLDKKKDAQENQISSEINHDFPITVLEEIFIMEKRMNIMDKDDKTYKILNRRTSNLKNKLNDMNYETIDYLGTKFNPNLNMKVDFIEDEEMQDGEEIVSRVIKPQINYNKKLIKPAEVIVSMGVKDGKK